MPEGLFLRLALVLFLESKGVSIEEQKEEWYHCPTCSLLQTPPRRTVHVGKDDW